LDLRGNRVSTGTLAPGERLQPRRARNRRRSRIHPLQPVGQRSAATCPTNSGDVGHAALCPTYLINPYFLWICGKLDLRGNRVSTGTLAPGERLQPRRARNRRRSRIHPLQPVGQRSAATCPTNSGDVGHAALCPYLINPYFLWICGKLDLCGNRVSTGMLAPGERLQPRRARNKRRSRVNMLPPGCWRQQGRSSFSSEGHGTH